MQLCELGKCFISYEIARARKAKTILIVTGKVGVTDSWAELLSNGEVVVNYYNWKFHGYKKTTTLNFDNP